MQDRNRQRWMSGGLACVLVCAGLGCVQASREEVVQRVLAEDPDFSSLMQQQQGIEEDVVALRETLRTERATYQRTQRTLKQEFSVRQADLIGQIQARLSRLDPERDRLERELQTVVHKLRLQSAEVRSLQQVVKALDEASQQATGEETYAARSRELLAKQAELAQSEALLKRQKVHRQMLKDKLRLLAVR